MPPKNKKRLKSPRPKSKAQPQIERSDAEVTLADFLADDDEDDDDDDDDDLLGGFDVSKLRSGSKKQTGSEAPTDDLTGGFSLMTDDLTAGPSQMTDDDDDYRSEGSNMDEEEPEREVCDEDAQKKSKAKFASLLRLVYPLARKFIMKEIWTESNVPLAKTGDLLKEMLTVSKAKEKASDMYDQGCIGFAFKGAMTDEPVEVMFKCEWIEDHNELGNEEWWTTMKLTQERPSFAFFKAQSPGKNPKLEYLTNLLRGIYRAARVVRKMDVIFMDWRAQVREERTKLRKEENVYQRDQWQEMLGWLEDVNLLIGDDDPKDDGPDMEAMIQEMRDSVCDLDEEAAKEIKIYANSIAMSYEGMRKEMKSLFQHSLHTLEEGEALKDEIDETTASVKAALAKFMGEVEVMKDVMETKRGQLELPTLPEWIPQGPAGKAKASKVNSVLLKVVRMADDVLEKVDQGMSGKVRRPKSRSQSRISNSNRGAETSCSSRNKSSLRGDSVEEWYTFEHVECGPGRADFGMQTEIRGFWKPARIGPYPRARAKLPKPKRLIEEEFYSVHTSNGNRKKENEFYYGSSAIDGTLKESVSYIWWRNDTNGEDCSVKKMFHPRRPYRLPPVSAPWDVEPQHGRRLKSCTPPIVQSEGTWTPPVKRTLSKQVLSGEKQHLPISVCLLTWEKLKPGTVVSASTGQARHRWLQARNFARQAVKAKMAEDSVERERKRPKETLDLEDNETQTDELPELVDNCTQTEESWTTGV